MRIQHHTGFHAQRFQHLHAAVDMSASLVVEGDDVGSRVAEFLEIAVGLNNHEMHVERLKCFFLNGLHQRNAVRDVRHEHPVHDVAMEPIGLTFIHHVDILRKIKEIS